MQVKDLVGRLYQQAESLPADPTAKWNEPTYSHRLNKDITWRMSKKGNHYFLSGDILVVVFRTWAWTFYVRYTHREIIYRHDDAYHVVKQPKRLAVQWMDEWLAV
jgi:hypothetical protein